MVRSFRGRNGRGRIGGSLTISQQNFHGDQISANGWKPICGMVRGLVNDYHENVASVRDLCLIGGGLYGVDSKI